MNAWLRRPAVIRFAGTTLKTFGKSERCNVASGLGIESPTTPRAPAGVRDEEADPRKPILQMAQKNRPAGLVLLRPLTDAQIFDTPPR